jgi:hypothetical protein
VHGWIYSLRDGLLVDLGFAAARSEEISPSWAAAVKAVGERHALHSA